MTKNPINDNHNSTPSLHRQPPDLSPKHARLVAVLHHASLVILFLFPRRPGCRHVGEARMCGSDLTVRRIGFDEQSIQRYPRHHLQILRRFQRAPVHTCTRTPCIQQHFLCSSANLLPQKRLEAEEKKKDHLWEHVPCTNAIARECFRQKVNR